MTVKAFVNAGGFTPLCLPSPEKEIDGVYVGDLLSWVMGNANQGNIWITIMSNINIVAVATLTDASCIILSEGVSLDSDVLSTAESKGINILSTSLPSYEAAIAVSELLK